MYAEIVGRFVVEPAVHIAPVVEPAVRIAPAVEQTVIVAVYIVPVAVV